MPYVFTEHGAVMLANALKSRIAVAASIQIVRAFNRMRLLNREIDQYYWDFLLTPDLIELRNIAVVATAVIRSAMARRESRGLHYTLDYPQPVEAERKDTLISRFDTPVVSA